MLRIGDLNVGSYVMDGNGIYKILRIKGSEVEVCEVEFNDNGYEEVTSDSWWKTRNEIEHCEMF